MYYTDSFICVCSSLLGNSQGSVQIVNACSGQVDREYSIHTSAVR